MLLMESNLENKLISKSINGDSAAFGLLMRDYRNRLYGYLWKLCGNKSVTEDLFQETLIKVWKGFPRYNEQNKFSSWLFSIAHNVALDSFRKAKVRERVIHTDQVPEKGLEDNQLKKMEVDELEESVMKVVANLPAKQRQVFLLRQHGEMTFKEISKLTEEPLNTVLSHMNYAVKKLKKVLREENVI